MYTEPSVKEFEPSHGRVDGGTLMTVTGTNFGPIAIPPVTPIPRTIAVGGSPCSDVGEIIETGQLTCLTPSLLLRKRAAQQTGLENKVRGGVDAAAPCGVVVL